MFGVCDRDVVTVLFVNWPMTCPPIGIVPVPEPGFGILLGLKKMLFEPKMALN